jgi:hypothetical protein
MVLLLLLEDLLDLAELDELVDGLEGHAGVILDLLVVHHLVHVVRRHRAHDVLVLLVVPHLSVLVEAALVEFVEECEGARLVILLLFLLQFLLLVLGLADEQDGFALEGILLLDLLLGLDVEVVGVVEVLGEVLGLLRLLGEQFIDLVQGREEGEVLLRHHFEAGQQLGVAK